MSRLRPFRRLITSLGIDLDIPEPEGGTELLYSDTVLDENTLLNEVGVVT